MKSFVKNVWNLRNRIRYQRQEQNVHICTLLISQYSPIIYHRPFLSYVPVPFSLCFIRARFNAKMRCKRQADNILCMGLIFCPSYRDPLQVKNVNSLLWLDVTVPLSRIAEAWEHLAVFFPFTATKSQQSDDFLLKSRTAKCPDFKSQHQLLHRPE